MEVLEFVKSEVSPGTFLLSNDSVGICCRNKVKASEKFGLGCGELSNFTSRSPSMILTHLHQKIELKGNIWDKKKGD